MPTIIRTKTGLLGLQVSDRFSDICATTTEIATILSESSHAERADKKPLFDMPVAYMRLLSMTYRLLIDEN